MNLPIVTHTRHLAKPGDKYVEGEVVKVIDPNKKEEEEEKKEDFWKESSEE